MIKRWTMWAAPLALATLLALAPWATARTTAQMGPMIGQPLEQLSGDDFDKAFLAQMTMHHAMAVMMTRPVVANAQHDELKALGSKIVEDQTREMAQMRGWLRDWYGIDLPDMVAMMDAMQSGQMPMTPQGHGMPTGMMQDMSMGMMQHMSMMAELWKLPPARLEAVFMSQMVVHHQGAVDMAMLAPGRAAHQELVDLAQGIVESQTDEIRQMNDWLAAWYGL
jgi:uncharacterized protein (DUF305 family)